MTLRINDTAPNFTAQTTEGEIDFHAWIGDGWALLFSHPKDFTPVCTTELGAVAGLKGEFAQRGCKIIGISVDGVSDHERWAQDIASATGHAPNYPLIGDPALEVVKLYDMLPADAGDTSEGRTPADNATARSVFLIGPDKKIKATLTYHRTQLRGDPASARLAPAHRDGTGGHPGELAAGRGRDHPAGGLQRGRPGEVPGRLAAAAALHPGRAAAASIEPRASPHRRASTTGPNPPRSCCWWKS